MTLPLAGANYYVDFDGGDNARDGLTPNTAFKHAPGDTQATGNPATIQLKAGDAVFFKGGVAYRGSVDVKVSGNPGQPIIYDGNTEGKWGVGRAVIEGGTPLGSWKRCASAEEAGGNPRWAEIFYTEVPRPRSYNATNLSDATGPLPLAQHPNPKDFFWQEHMENYFVTSAQLQPEGKVRVKAGKGFSPNAQRPLHNLILEDAKKSAVICPIPNAAFTLHPEAPVEIVTVGVKTLPKYTAVREIAFLADNKELMRVTLEKGNSEMQRFDLPSPVRLASLTVQVLSVYDDAKNNYTAWQQVAAWDKEGNNVLQGGDTMSFRDPANLTGKPEGYYNGMIFAVHAGNNFIFYLPVLGYDAVTGTLRLPYFDQPQYKETRYSLFNSVRLIDHPGEYSVEKTAAPKISRVYLLPAKVENDQPAETFFSTYGHAFALEEANHITVRGFLIRRQKEAGLRARKGSDIIFSDNEVTLVRGGSAIRGNDVKGITIEGCYIHDNPGRTRGILLHACSNGVTRENRLVRNTLTALCYNTCTDGHVVGNIVLENKGAHSNGLTFYAGNKNILVERNHVAKGKIALTFAEGENLTFQNNLLDANGAHMVVGIWPKQPLKNIRILHNTIIGSNPGKTYTTGIFANIRQIGGLVLENNIIDGLYSDHQVFKGQSIRNNLYTRIGKDQENGLLGEDELTETDLSKIFADPEKGNYRLREGSPAVGAGYDAGVKENIEGKPRNSAKVNMGAF